MSRRPPTPVERLFAAALYAPIGLGAQLVDDVPRAVSKVRQQVVLARFLGKMVVDQGSKELRERLETAAKPTRPRDPDIDIDVDTPAEDEGAVAAPRSGSDRAPSRTVDPIDPIEPVADRVPSPVPVADIALPDYDQLPAAHIVGKLAGLTSSELEQVEAYESAHRHRRTVLGKIDQLRAEHT